MKNAIKFVFAALFVFCLVLCTIIFIRLTFFETVDEPYSQTDVTASVRSERRNFLILGRDEVSGLCDVMMLLSYDKGERSATVLQIPRDTYAEYAGGSYSKLNGALSRLGGEDELCAFLSDALSVEIDYYVTLDLDAVGEVVDAIGGVEVDVPFDMDYDDPAQGLSIHLDAGRCLLDGDAARQFVRYRSGYVRGDIGRMDAQKIFLAALVGKIKSGISLAEAGNIVIGLRDDVSTNLSFDEMAGLVRGAFSLPLENIKFITLAGEEATASESGASYYVISRPAAAEILNKYFGAEVSAESFDGEGLFLNERYSEFERIYSTYSQYGVLSAAEISHGGLDIAHK